jgi:uncharacterized protein DUF4831
MNTLCCPRGLTLSRTFPHDKKIRLTEVKKMNTLSRMPQLFSRRRNEMVKLRTSLAACLVATALLFTGCFKSKNEVSKIPPVDGKLVKLDGVPYALPRTVVQARVPFKLKTKSPGEFEKYVPCFFSPQVAAGRVREKSKVFSIDPPTFTSRGEPDPNEHYIAKIKGGLFENKTLFLEFNEDGVITKGEASSTNTAIDVVIAGARTAVSVASRIASGGVASPVPNGLTAQDKTAFEDARIDLCRGAIIAATLREAAAAADAAAKASGDGTARGHADTALAESALIDQQLAVAARDFAAIADAFERGDNPTFNAALNTFRGSNGNLLHNVLGKAVIVKGAVVGVASQLAAEPAKAVRDAAERIDTAFKQTGVAHSCRMSLTAEQIRVCSEKPEADRTEGEKGVCNELARCEAEIRLRQDAFANGYAEAREKYNRLVELRKNREQLVTGASAPPNLSADAFKLLLAETDATINNYEKGFFLGTEDSSDAWTADFEFRPGRAIVSNSFNTFQTSPPLMVFSPTAGLCATPEADDQGIKIKSSFKAEKCSPLPNDGKALWVSVRRLTDDDGYLGHMAAANRRDEDAGKRGFYYRIPAKSLVKLESGKLTGPEILTLEQQSETGQKWSPDTAAPAGALFVPTGSEVGRGTMKVAQLGVTASIPASSAGRTTQYTVEFDAATGALKNFRLASNALLEKSLVDEIGGAAGDVLSATEARRSAREAREKAEAEANDPLTQKKRELELLKTENAINDEKKKLTDAQGAQPASTPPPDNQR